MQDKYSSLAPPMGILLSYSMSLTGCQINPIDVNFHKKVWKFFIKIQLTSFDPKKDKEIKVSPFMPIRVNLGSFFNSVPSTKNVRNHPTFQPCKWLRGSYFAHSFRIGSI